ncbi:MAG: hypothetical protein H8E55_72330 [Pelagibacterales bacterium]|nr:hypothetical protein [Pelagibacterales bacterium]
MTNINTMTNLDTLFISESIQNHYAEYIALEDINDEFPEYVDIISDGEFKF